MCTVRQRYLRKRAGRTAGLFGLLLILFGNYLRQRQIFVIIARADLGSHCRFQACHQLGRAIEGLRIARQR